MSMKKKVASTLVDGVRQIKSQREQASAPTPATAAPVAKPRAKPTSASVVAKPVAPRTAPPPELSLYRLHPRRIWPD